jgi:hypothetical protein
MPALNLYRPPLDTTRPSARRVWAYPELQSHSLMVLTLGELYLAPLTGEPRDEQMAAAEGDGNLDELFGPLATVIGLASIQRAKLDLLTNTLMLDIMRAQHHASRLTIAFATSEAADSCLSRLWRRLGDGCTLLSHRPDWRPLARLPLICLAIVLAVTAALSLLASTADELPATGGAASVNVPGSPVLSGPLESLDWRVICAAGGAAAAATQVWLYRRLTQPPVSLEVNRN